MAGPTNLFIGNITDGTGGGTVAVTKTGTGTWVLSGSNNYSGTTTLSPSNPAGTLVFSGSQSLSPNTTIVGSQNSSSTHAIRFLDDGVGTIAFNRPINFGGNNTSQSLGIFVGNNNTANLGTTSGTTTGSTIQSGDITFTSTATDTGTTTVNVTGDNGYRLQTGTITLNNLVTRTAGSTTVTALSPTTANMTVAAITMATGNQGIALDGVPVLRFTGTSSDNYVTGVISNASDYLTGQELSVQKQSTSTWTLQGSSTYTGTTAITGGTLASTNAVQGFGMNLDGISIGGSGTLGLLNNSSVSFTNGTSPYNISNSASGSTINVDRVSGTGSNTITVGNLTTSSTAATWAMNFTGANGVSLNAGAVTTPTTASAATHTINNNIAGGGSLTLASVASGSTNSATLVFNGTSNTNVSGAITEAATTNLTKNGTGTLTLGGTSSYTGNTTVSAGTLLVNGSIATSANTSVASVRDPRRFWHNKLGHPRQRRRPFHPAIALARLAPERRPG